MITDAKNDDGWRTYSPAEDLAIEGLGDGATGRLVGYLHNAVRGRYPRSAAEDPAPDGTEACRVAQDLSEPGAAGCRPGASEVTGGLTSSLQAPRSRGDGAGVIGRWWAD